MSVFARRPFVSPRRLHLARKCARRSFIKGRQQNWTKQEIHDDALAAFKAEDADYGSAILIGILTSVIISVISSLILKFINKWIDDRQVDAPPTEYQPDEPGYCHWEP